MKKYYVTPTKKNSRDLKKDHGKPGSENFNQWKLAKKLSICKHEKVFPIKYGSEPSSEKVSGSLKFKVMINDTASMKLNGVRASKGL